MFWGLIGISFVIVMPAAWTEWVFSLVPSLIGKMCFNCNIFWVLLGSFEFLWVPLGSFGFLWVPLGSFGFLWVPLGSFGFLWVPLGSFGFL